MPQHMNVSTTCTASHLVNWDIPNLNSKNEKERVNARLRTVDELIRGGFKLDFAMIFCTTTGQQVRNNGLDDFLPKIGFELTFKGEKDLNENRHKETGELYMWCAKPKDYKAALESYHKELTEIKERIDPPKRPDPARQKFDDLKLSDLRKAGIVFNNASVDNPINQVLDVKPEKALRFLKMKFGFDPTTKWKGENEWLTKTTRMLKDAQRAWKNELV